MPQASSVTQQVIEAEVSGPAGANRLYLCTGTAIINTWTDGSKTETWTFFVGPTLQVGQFRRAAGSASIAGFAFTVPQVAAGMTVAHGQHVRSLEADWDDDSGQTEVRVEVEATTQPGTTIHLTSLAFSASILAAV
jgi:hypothetical protein